jgi:drug/metabolite transporter (DMT)-like permease
VSDPAHQDHGAADWLLLVVPGVIWGASFLFIAEALGAVRPNGLTFLRILVGFLTLACFSAARAPIPRSAYGQIAILAIVWMAFPLSMFPFAEERVTSAMAGMLNGAVPLSTAIVASFLARAMPARGVALGLAIGLTGTVLVAWPTLGEGQSSAIGVLLILLAVASYGFALNVARPLQLRYGALPVIWRAQAVALLLTAPLGVRDALAAHWSVVPALSLLALGALGTGAAFVFAAIAAGKFGATAASATAFLMPTVALFLGVLFRAERVAALSIAGSVVCVLGAWIIRRSS